MELIRSRYQEGKELGFFGSNFLPKFLSVAVVVMFCGSFAQAADPLGDLGVGELGMGDQSPADQSAVVRADQRGRLAEQSASASKESAPYAHAVIIHSLPSHPSMLLFVSGDSRLHSVRALLHLDGKLLIMPMIYFPATSSYQVTYPTPVKDLDYQFQLELADKSLQLTERHKAENNCRKAILQDKTEESFKGQRELLADALKLEQEIAAVGLSRNFLKGFGAENNE